MTPTVQVPKLRGIGPPNDSVINSMVFYGELQPEFDSIRLLSQSIAGTSTWVANLLDQLAQQINRQSSVLRQAVRADWSAINEYQLNIDSPFLYQRYPWPGELAQVLQDYMATHPNWNLPYVRPVGPS